MKIRNIVALSACLFGPHAAVAQASTAVTHAAPIKTFSQKVAEPLVTETKVIAQSQSEAQAVRIKQDLEQQFDFSINFKSAKEASSSEATTVMRSPLHLSHVKYLASPSCDLKGTIEDIEVAGNNPKTGYEAVITPTQKTEDGIIALVNLTIHKGVYESMQSLSPNCTVLEGKQSTDSLIRVVALSYGNKTTITTDSGAEIEITLKPVETTEKSPETENSTLKK